MLSCPHCGSERAFWISFVFFRLFDYPCDVCGQPYRLNHRGLAILFGGGAFTALLAWGARYSSGYPFSPMLVTALGLLLTGDATRRFGELVKKED